MLKFMSSRNFNSTLFLFILIIFVAGCYKDKEELLYPNLNANDCSNPSIQMGPKFSAVQAVVQANCVTCHKTGGTSPDFSNACNIVDKWSRIKTRCVDQQTMPPSGPLPATAQQAIVDWVNAGHLYTN
jgi:uncharacterized membrane protein